MTQPQPEEQIWKFCPACGRPSTRIGQNPFRCGDCDFVHYFSSTVAIGALAVREDGKMLFIVRQKDPGKGQLGLPGGFVDPEETVEEALKREIREEVNLQIESAEYLASFPNVYDYRGIRRPVTDLFFVAKVASFDSIVAEQGEVEDWCFLDPAKLQTKDLAFYTHMQAIQCYLSSD